ncbi:IS630 family transposase [Roseibacillus persicicus]|uniref:IS630 family transposase n=1 Tax=Roseibacillus persicicus TaxID=454148 RepID=UPI00398A67A4
MSCCRDRRSEQRLSAIHLLLVGVTFEHTIAHFHMSERTLRLWISRFNEAGIDGLTYRPGGRPPRKLTSTEIDSQITPYVNEPSKAGQTHWTATKLCGWLRREKKLDLSYSTLVRYLHEKGFVRRLPRPVPEPSDPQRWEEQREAFAEELITLMEDPQTVVFFGDEVGFEGDPRPRHKWVQRGSSPTQGYHGGHVRQNVIGAINPSDGQLVSLLVPQSDTEVFQAFLDTMAKEVPPIHGEVWLVLDNASWHKSKALNWHHIRVKFLPPYSPDFNPIERLCQHLKRDYLAGFVTRHGRELNEKVFQSIRALLKEPDVLKSVCNPYSE